jgi:hypothetical protein
MNEPHRAHRHDSLPQLHLHRPLLWIGGVLHRLAAQRGGESRRQAREEDPGAVQLDAHGEGTAVGCVPGYLSPTKGDGSMKALDWIKEFLCWLLCAAVFYLILLL